MKNFYSEFKRLRMANGMTMAQLAQKLGVSVAYIGNIERGMRRPSPLRLAEIADIYKMNQQERDSFLLLYCDTVKQIRVDVCGKSPEKIREMIQMLKEWEKDDE